MGFFSNILEKLGIKKDKGDKPATTSAATAEQKSEIPAAKTPIASGASSPIKPDQREGAMSLKDREAAPAVKAVSEVDVMAKLEEMSAGFPGLNWKSSIVDMLKVLGIDSSKDARIELAKELGCPADLIGGDYSKMNVWLHKEVLKKIAENGGNIPANLLD
ncbi:MAG: DUF3597 domain-containing protein [Anaerolineales bacterium]|nr:DUF3597 domain-containing protein [Anaerolineales bacterium]